MNGLKKSSALIMVIVFTMVFSILATSFVHAETPVNVSTTTVGNLTIKREVIKSAALKNSDITITYTVTPKEIDSNLQAPTKKDVILVLDSSSSMNKTDMQDSAGNYITRTKAAVDGAFALLKHLKSLNTAATPDLVRVGLISFSKFGKIIPFGTNYYTTNFGTKDSDVEKAILGIWNSQGTNMGDGLRAAYYQATLGSYGMRADADKYIIVLSDGKASYHSVKTGTTDFFTAESGNFAINASFPSESVENNKNYCYAIADMIKAYNDVTTNKKIKPYLIAYSPDSDRTLLNTTATRAGGSTGDVYEANTTSGLLGVFKSIGEDISKNYNIKNVKFEQTFPVGLSLPSGVGITLPSEKTKVEEFIGDFTYTLNTTSMKYIPTPSSYSFSYTIKCSEAGNYLLSNNDNPTLLTYEGSTGASLEQLPLKVVALDAPITVNKVIDPEDTIINSPVTAKYTITPGEILIDPLLDKADLPAELVIDNVKIIEEGVPGGVTLDVPEAYFDPDTGIDPDTGKDTGTLTYPIDPIPYKLNDDKTKYIPENPDPDPVEIPITPTEPGDYSWPSKVVYEDFYDETKEKDFGEKGYKADEYGDPTFVVTSVKKHNEEVDVHVSYTLPSFTASATIVLKGDGYTPVPLLLTNGNLTFSGLSIYEDHEAIITSTSTTGVTNTFEGIIFDAIGVN